MLAGALGGAASTVRLQPGGPAPATTGGLINLGNSCFMNASLQCMFHVPALWAALLKGVHGEQCRLGPWHCVTCAMEDICADVMRNCGATAPRALFQALPTISRSLTPGRQEDAHEFVRHLVDMMQRDMARAQGIRIEKPLAMQLEVPGTLAHELFIGRTRSRVRCMACGAVSDMEEPFEDVSLGINALNSVTDALRRFTAQETLSGDNAYRCDACERHTSATKQVTLHHMPPVLVIHLKRFAFDSWLASKMSHFVRYPLSLDVRPYYSGPYKALPSYELYGVVSHSGSSPRSGHYTCLVRRSAKGGWMAKSDSFVRGASQDQALNSQAYMLFYVLPGKAAATVAAANGQAEPRHAAAAARTGTTNNNASPPRPRPMIGPPVPDWLRGGAGPGAAARAQDSSSSDGPAAAERGDSSDGSPPDWGPGAGLDAKGPPAVASPTSNPLRSAQPAWGRTPGLAEIRGNVAAGAAAKRVELARAPATTRPASPRRALPSHDQQAGPGTPVGTVRWPPQGGPAAVARRNTAMVPSQVRRQFSATHQGAAPAMVGNGAHSPHDTAHPPTAAPPSTALPGTAPPSAAPPSTAPATGMPAGAPSYSRPLNPLHGTVFVNDVPRMPDCAAAAKERSAAGGVGDAAQGAEARSGARENGVKRQGSEPDRSARERPSSHRKARSRSPRRWPESRNVSVSSDEGRSRSRGRSGGRGSAHRRRDNGESSHRSSHRSRDKGGSRDRGRGRDRGRARSRSRRHLHESRHRERSRSRSRKTSRRTPPSSSPSKKRSRSRRSRGSEDRKRSRRRHSERAEAEGEDGGKRRRHHKSKKGSKKRRGRRGDEDRA